MLVQRVASLLKIRPEEARLVALVAGLFLCIQAGGGMGDNAASALFLLRFGADFLPYMYMALGGLNFVLALAYSAGLGRFKKDRFFIGLLASFAALLLLERAALLNPVPALYPILWLTISGVSLILGTFVWNVAGGVCDARQAKRLFPLFTSAGILGSVLGNSITGIAAKAIGTENLLILHAALLGLALFLTYRIARGYFKPVKKSAGRQSLWNDLRVGYDFVRASRLMQFVAYASILFSILFFGVTFPFNKVVSASFPDEAQVAGFLGLFSSLSTATTFLVSLFLANRLYARLGITNSILLLPVTYLFGFTFFAFNYNLTGAVTARFSQLVILSGAADSAWNALFNVVPSQKRGQVLAFQNGVPSQVGVLLSGVLLILGEKILTTQQIFLLSGAVALLCGLLIWRMRSAYGEALIAALRAGRVEVFSSQETAFAGFQGDVAAIRVAVQTLSDAKPSARRLAAQMLARMQAKAAIPALTKSLSDPDTSVRSTVLQALGDLKAHEATNAILSQLDDTDAGVRSAALASLTRLGLDSTADLSAKLDHWLNDPNVKVRLQAATLLIHFGSFERALPMLTRMLQDSRQEQRLLALGTIEQIAPALQNDAAPPLDIQPVRLALRDPSPAIRKMACKALGALRRETTITDLIDCLNDSDASVREAAATALSKFGDLAHSQLLHVLESKNGKAQDAILEVLSPRDLETQNVLLKYMRQEISNVQALRAQLASLAGEGRSSNFLRDLVRARMMACEKRLIKTVGLFGNPQAMALVRRSLHAGDTEARAAALETLETLGDKRLTQEIVPLLEVEALPAHNEPISSEPSATLETLLADHQPLICALTIRVIAELGLRSFKGKLRKLASSPHPRVANAACEALIQFGEESPMDTLQTVSTLERILLLREVPIFADLSPEDLEQVAEIVREQWFPDGAIICHTGEEGNALYVIVSGHIQVEKEVEGKVQMVASRGTGDFVGEMAIIESAPRTATLRAQGDSRVLVIEGEAFNAILRDRPEVAISVTRTLSRRLREMMN